MSLSSLKSAIAQQGNKKKRRSFKSRKEKRQEEEQDQKKRLKSSEAPMALTQASSASVASSSSSGSSVAYTTFKVEEVKRLLRDRGEPITLFGEKDQERAARLHKVEEAAPDQSHAIGQTNVFQQILEKLEKGAEQDEGEDPDLERLRELTPERSEGREDDISVYLLSVIEMWNKSKGSTRERARFKQTLLYILPLFQRLSARRLGEEQLSAIEKVIAALRKCDWKQAEDDYLMLAIGNSAWPLGVTSVGIHERSAREKISVGNTAHVLNDETQRKYIQSLKRLMTWVEEHSS